MGTKTNKRFAIASMDLNGDPCDYGTSSDDSGNVYIELFKERRLAKNERATLISDMIQNAMDVDKDDFKIVAVVKESDGRHFDTTHNVYIEEVLKESGKIQ